MLYKMPFRPIVATSLVAAAVAFSLLLVSPAAHAATCASTSAVLTTPPDANGDYVISLFFIEPETYTIYVTDRGGSLIDLNYARANQQPYPVPILIRGNQFCDTAPHAATFEFGLGESVPCIKSVVITPGTKKPVVSANYDRFTHKLSVPYEFPRSFTGFLSLQIDGNVYATVNTDRKGVWRPNLPSCFPDGPHTLTVIGQVCNSTDPKLYTSIDVPILAKNEPDLSKMALVPGAIPNQYVLSGHLSFPPETNGVGNYTIKTKTGVVLRSESNLPAEYDISPSTLTIDLGNNPSMTPIVDVTSVICGVTYTKALSFQDNSSCSSCTPSPTVGNPVRITSGNARETESEPLPLPGFAQIVRTYNSQPAAPFAGAYGRDRFSVFDSRLLRFSSDDSIVIQTEDSEWVEFNRESGVYVQKWPQESEQTSTLTSNADGS
jgi:hypothetical protein